MAELIAVTTITGTEQIINLDYVIQIEPHRDGALIVIASDDTSLNQLIVKGLPYQIAKSPRLV
jgi:hypothetical protein